MLLRSSVELHHRRLTIFFFLVSTSHILYNQSSLGVRVCYEVCSGIPSPSVARSHGSSSTILINEGIKITCPIITKPKYDIQKLQSSLARQQLGEKRGERERERDTCSRSWVVFELGLELLEGLYSRFQTQRQKENGELLQCTTK